MGNDMAYINQATMDIINGKWVSVWSKVSAVNVKFFRVTNNCPIHGDRFTHHAEFDKCSCFPNHLKSLLNGTWMSRCFDIHIAPIALR